MHDMLLCRLTRRTWIRLLDDEPCIRSRDVYSLSFAFVALVDSGGKGDVVTFEHLRVRKAEASGRYAVNRACVRLRITRRKTPEKERAALWVL